jgi:MarR family transcriptional regulator, lower aerobic nicotinate degradation pathway regulator
MLLQYSPSGSPESAAARPRSMKKKSAPDGSLEALYGRPAFMIRRAHQIATAVFTQSCAKLDLTLSQYSILFTLHHRGPVGQNELGRLVSLDRSTTGFVVNILKGRKLLTTSDDPKDKRKTLVALTDRGRLLLASAEQLNTQASQDLLSAFDERQARTFIKLLEKLTTSKDTESQP